MLEHRLDVLLISETQRSWWHLTRHLEQRGCVCWSASTHEKVRALLGQRPFRLVLSTRPVTERNTLMELLRAPGRFVFYSFPIEGGCLWFQAIPEIPHSSRTSALRPSAFMSNLDDLISSLSVTPGRPSINAESNHRATRRLTRNASVPISASSQELTKEGNEVNYQAVRDT